MAKHFADAFQSLQGVDLATSKADAKGTSLGAKNPILGDVKTSIQKIGTSIYGLPWINKPQTAG